MVCATSIAEENHVLRLAIIDVMHFKIAALATEHFAARGPFDLSAPQGTLGNFLCRNFFRMALTIPFHCLCILDADAIDALHPTCSFANTNPFGIPGSTLAATRVDLGAMFCLSFPGTFCIAFSADVSSTAFLAGELKKRLLAFEPTFAARALARRNFGQ
jgi:hypothetical protein